MRDRKSMLIMIALVMIVICGGLFLLNGESYETESKKDSSSEKEVENDENTIDESEATYTIAEDKTEEKHDDQITEMADETGAAEQSESQSSESVVKQEEGTSYSSGTKEDELVNDNENKEMVYDSEAIMTILDQSVISDSGTYLSYFKKNRYENSSINAYGKERTDCFSVNTAVSYNLWGGGTQYVIFNIEDLNAKKSLEFTICGEKGTEGEMNVSVYIDRELEGDPDYNYHFDSCTVPQTASIDIRGASSMGILVNNMCSRENRMVFYDLAVSDE